MCQPISGDVIFRALNDRKTIVMAVNARSTAGIVKGIFRAAKDMDAAVIFEIARSECNQDVGYTGMTPEIYAREVMGAASEVGHDIWALHADHITVKKGDGADIAKTKELIDAQVAAGFTSFAIDASHLYDFRGGGLREELALNIDATTKLAKHIESRMGGRPFGLEVEVGEIGKENEHGKVVTTPEEATTFISALNENGVFPHVIAIANGTTHGNVYDAAGNLVEDISIDIEQTKAVARALRDMGSEVRIAQHGITGTPRDKINTMFPKGDIIKGNVATFWQNMVFDIIKVYDPDLYSRIWNWTLETYGPKIPGKPDEAVFGKNAKNAFRPFYDEIHGLPESAMTTLESMAYAEARIFFSAFSAEGTASIVRQAMEKPGIVGEAQG